jgi:hypothetical protein
MQPTNTPLGEYFHGASLGVDDKTIHPTLCNISFLDERKKNHKLA